MLLGIPSILSPELLKVLCEMGHGDTIAIGDGNFPAQSVGRNGIVVRCDGHGVPQLLDAILQVFPLDDYVQQPVSLMQVTPGDTTETPIWEEYEKILAHRSGKSKEQMEEVERFAFYRKAEEAYAVIATGESALYANIILQKGVVPPEQ